MLKRTIIFIILMLSSYLLRANIVILNGLSHNYKVENGQIYKGKISIENTSNEPQNIKLFLQDFNY